MCGGCKSGGLEGAGHVGVDLGVFQLTEQLGFHAPLSSGGGVRFLGRGRAGVPGGLARAAPIRPGWPACDNGVVIDPSQDAFGAALLDYLEGKEVPGLVLEEEGGQAGPALRPECFFRSSASRRLLARLAELVIPGAVLVGDSVTLGGPARVVLRIRYRDLVTPWWPQYNIPAGQMAALVDGTGWRMELHLEDGEDHAVLLRRA